MDLPNLSAIFAVLVFFLIALYLILREQRQKVILWQEKQKKEKELVSKDEFTHMIVHELRAPTTAIKDAALLLRSSFETLDKKEKSTLIDMIADQSKKMLEQISTLLDAAKIKAGKVMLEKTKSDFASIISQQMSVFEPVAQSKHISVTIDIQKNLPNIIIDPVRIGQVINNLLSNSLKFTNNGGTIQISAKKNGQIIEVSVSDTGVGIPLENQKDLFSKFEQVLETNKEKQGKPHGTGLGLYIVRGIVEAHGGTVTLTSKPSIGTTVSFTLPVSAS